jgi:Periplasmic binding protein
MIEMGTPNTSRRAIGRACAVGLTAALITAACGSSSSHAAKTSSSQSYSVLVMGTFTSAESVNVPEMVPAAQAAFAGTGVKVLSCNDMETSSGGLDCEHEAVADHVAAVIGGFAELAVDESILTQAGIPAIGDTDTTSSISFGVSSGTGTYPGIGIALSRAGCTRLGILYLDGTDFLADAIVDGGTWQSVTRAAIPANAPDVTPDIAKLAEGNVQCVALSTFPTTIPQAMIAIKQDGLKVKVAAVSGILTPQVLKAIGPDSNGMISIESQVDPEVSSPVLTLIKSEMKAVDPSAPVTVAAIDSWASAKLIIDAAKTISGPVTAATLRPAMNALRNASTDGAIPPFSAIPLPNPAFARFFNHYEISYVIDNGVPTHPSGFVDMTAALEKAKL